MVQERRYHCNNCNTSFSATVGTLFHQTHLSLWKWFQAIALLLNPRGAPSVRQLAQCLEVNKDTAWRMALKIREAMTEREQRELLFRIFDMSWALPGRENEKEKDNFNLEEKKQKIRRQA
jgi:transposase-like protein